MYHLNIEVLSHRTNKKHLLVFEKKDKAMYFVGEYRLTEMRKMYSQMKMVCYAGYLYFI